MDLPRSNRTNPTRKWVLWTALVGVLVAVSAVGLADGAGPAKPVKRAAIYTAQVERGPMLRAVHGRGTLVPKDIRWITADTAGRVEEIRLRPGVSVEEDTLLVVLSNSDVELKALEAESELAAAQAELADVQAGLDTERLQRKSDVAALRAGFLEAERRVAGNESLAASQAVTKDALDASREQADAAKSRLSLSRKQLEVLSRSAKSRVAAQEARVARLSAVVEFRRRQVGQMHVQAGGSGVLQDLPLEVGQWVIPGTVLAKVVRPEQLAAELQIPEGQAKDIAVGQVASVDTRNGMAPGKVVRVDPSVVDGSVTVEVGFDEQLPDGVRPDLSIEGTIEIERIKDVIVVKRPVGVHSEMNARVFRLEESGEAAEAVFVSFGRASVDTIEVLSGLGAADEIIVSDTSTWGETTRVVFE